MPGKRKTYKKRLVVKKARKAKPKFQSLVNVPAHLTANVALTYSENILMPFTATVPGTYQFNLNNIFDCNRTGAGYQPMYRDQIYGFYEKAFVNAARYTITASSTSFSCDLLVRAATDETVLTATMLGFDTISQRPGAIFKTFSLGSPAITVTGYVNNPKIWGLTKSAYYGEVGFQNTGGAGPSTGYQTVLNLMSAPTNRVSSGTMNVRIKIVYYCTFRDRLPMSLS